MMSRVTDGAQAWPLAFVRRLPNTRAGLCRAAFPPSFESSRSIKSFFSGCAETAMTASVTASSSLIRAKKLAPRCSPSSFESAAAMICSGNLRQWRELDSVFVDPEAWGYRLCFLYRAQPMLTAPWDSSSSAVVVRRCSRSHGTVVVVVVAVETLILRSGCSHLQERPCRATQRARLLQARVSEESLHLVAVKCL